MLAPTDTQGKATLRLETRILGDNTITPAAPEFAASTFVVTVGEAWFVATFKITAYNCCDEDDFTGDKVDAKNVGKRKQDFVFSGRGVCMQGTGVGTDGKYISISNPGDIQWNPGYAGVKNPDAAVFVYSTAVTGAYGALTADGSIAIDPTILPKHHRVDIIGPRALGERKGDDTGGAIKGHHIDNYAGAGKAAIDAWTAAGGNIEHAVVKYLGA
jgi:3D (Asp-Asp-Asp) domain-containing protein